MKETLGEPARHFWMTRSVARVMGINLADALQTQALTAETYASMVTNCRGCALVEACEEWLSRSPDTGTSCPPGCCHSEILHELRKRF